MKKGMLITNSFLNSSKFSKHYEWLDAAAKRKNIDLTEFGNADFMVRADQMTEPDWLNDFDFILFWDKDIRLGRYLSFFCKQKNIPIFNTPEAVEACDDKYETYLRLMAWNQTHTSDSFSLIPTILAPMTYPSVGYKDTMHFLSRVEETLGYPLIVKECFGSFGMQVYQANTREELVEITKSKAGTPLIYQKEIQESFGTDVRLQVVDGRVVAGMKRNAEKGDFRANISHGGSMSAYPWNEKEAKVAIAVAKALQLDFAGVDLLFEHNQATLVCEVNSNAHFHNLYQCTGVNVADEIMSMIQKRI